MKRILLSLCLVIWAIIGFAQTYPTPYGNLGSPTTGVQNRGGMFVNGMFQGPTFLDTTHANNSGYAANYPGSLIFTTSDDNLWKRNSSITAWDLVGSGNGYDTVYTKAPIAVYTDSTGHQVIYFLQNGLISGGIITQAGCLQIGVTAANYGINYKSYTSASTILTVAASDPSNPRTDAVVADTLGNVYILEGTPSTPAQAPSISPSYQVLLGTYTLQAGASCLGLYHETIYDENLGATSEWNTSSSGTISTNFNNTANPYHLTKADFTTTYINGSQLIFSKGSNDTAQTSEVLNFFVYLNIALGSNQLQISFLNGSTVVGNPIAFNVGYGLNPNNLNSYQNISIPFSAFNLGTSVFTEMIIQFAGNDISGAGGLYIDYIQLQTGGTQTSAQLVLTTNGTSGAATYNPITNILNIPQYSGGGGIGNTNTNVGSGYRLAIPNTNQIKTLFNKYGTVLDSTTNTNGISITVDTTLLLTKADSSVAGGYYPYSTNPKGYLSSIDTSNISNFSVKVRSLFSAAAPITYNSATGKFGADTSTAITGLATQYDVSLKLSTEQDTVRYNRVLKSNVTYTALPNDLVAVSATTKNDTIYLPNAPSNKTYVTVKIIAVTAGDSVVVICQGTDTIDISGGTTIRKYFILNQADQFMYSSASKIWTIIAKDPGSSLTLSTSPTTTGAATLSGATLTIPLPASETQVASSTAVTFSVVTIPTTYGAYTVFHNGVALTPTTDYTTSGQVVTSTYFISGDTVTVETR